jgi:hypothetical protein
VAGTRSCTRAIARSSTRISTWSSTGSCRRCGAREALGPGLGWLLSPVLGDWRSCVWGRSWDQHSERAEGEHWDTAGALQEIYWKLSSENKQITHCEVLGYYWGAH